MKSYLLPFLLIVLGLIQITFANPYLDISLRVSPKDDFCGARTCNITYALSVLRGQNHFDLHSIMLQDGKMMRQFDAKRNSYHFEESTVIRLSRELLKSESRGKLYLGFMLFDVPKDIQDYVIMDVSDVVHKREHVKELKYTVTEAVKFDIQVHRRNEASLHDANQRSQHNMFQIDHTGSHLRSRSLLSSFHEARQPGGASCKCIKKNCGCCEVMTVPKIHLNDSVCLNISYVSEDIGIKFSLSVNDHVYYSEEISARNPPPVCFEVPHLREYASLCARFYNMDVSKMAVKGCVEVEAELLHVRIARAKIGCFTIPI